MIKILFRNYKFSDGKEKFLFGKINFFNKIFICDFVDFEGNYENMVCFPLISKNFKKYEEFSQKFLNLVGKNEV